MDSSFSKGLGLQGMSSNTAIVVWLMVAFLSLLIVGLSAALIKKLNQDKTANTIAQVKGKDAKGF